MKAASPKGTSKSESALGDSGGCLDMRRPYIQNISECDSVIYLFPITLCTTWLCQRKAVLGGPDLNGMRARANEAWGISGGQPSGVDILDWYFSSRLARPQITVDWSLHGVHFVLDFCTESWLWLRISTPGSGTFFPGTQPGKWTVCQRCF